MRAPEPSAVGFIAALSALRRALAHQLRLGRVHPPGVDALAEEAPSFICFQKSLRASGLKAS